MENASGESEAGSRAAQAVMAALDVSGDGFIEYHEFLAAVLDRQRTLTDQTIAEMFGTVSLHFLRMKHLSPWKMAIRRC